METQAQKTDTKWMFCFPEVFTVEENREVFDLITDCVGFNGDHKSDSKSVDDNKDELSVQFTKITFVAGSPNYKNVLSNNVKKSLNYMNDREKNEASE